MSPRWMIGSRISVPTITGVNRWVMERGPLTKSDTSNEGMGMPWSGNSMDTE